MACATTPPVLSVVFIVAQATEAARLAETRMAAALKESVVGKEGLNDLIKVAETLVGTPSQRHHLHHLGLRLAGVEQALGAAHEMERAQASALHVAQEAWKGEWSAKEERDRLQGEVAALTEEKRTIEAKVRCVWVRARACARVRVCV